MNSDDWNNYLFCTSLFVFASGSEFYCKQKFNKSWKTGSKQCRQNELVKF